MSCLVYEFEMKVANSKHINTYKVSPITRQKDDKAQYTLQCMHHTSKYGILWGPLHPYTPPNQSCIFGTKLTVHDSNSKGTFYTKSAIVITAEFEYKQVV